MRMDSSNEAMVSRRETIVVSLQRLRVFPDSSTHRGKSRGGRSRFQQNGGDSQHTTGNQTHQSDASSSQQRPRGGGSAYRGRNRGQNRPGYRPNDRAYSQQPHDSNVDSSVPSDTIPHPTDVSHGNRRGRGGAGAARHQTQEQWDVGNWNGETLIYSRTTKEEEQHQQKLNSDEASNVLSEGTDRFLSV